MSRLGHQPESTTPVEQLLARWKSDVEGELDRLLPPAEAPPRSLHGAMRHAVFAGGKRIRPILLLSASEALGSPAETTLGAASAIEMIHTYSLIHDDLPAMDDDQLRRGKPTTHIAFGEAIAILAGDALLTLAFELLARHPAGAPAERRAEVVLLVAHAAGAAGMVGGQADDLAAGRSPEPVSEEHLISIHRRKTGALITASVLAGAVLAGADAEQRRRLRKYAEAIGLAFQVVDDILDVESTTAELGKSAGKDARDAKLTFPAILGLEESRRRAEQLCQEARFEAEALGPKALLLGEIAAFIVARTH
jgi:geranylgeranyl diphosphate synthase type II